MSKRKARVWTFFVDIEGDNRKVRCNQCQSLISRGGSGKAANTTIPASSEPESSSSSQSSLSVARLTSASHQQNIVNCLTPVWSIDDARSTEIHIYIAKMIALDNQPISCVEDIGFRNLIRKLKPKYNMPSRKYFADNIIPRIYNDTRNFVKISRNLHCPRRKTSANENRIRKQLEKKVRFGKKKVFALATLLDPRYKLQFFDAETVPIVKSQFLLEALQNDDCDSEPEPENAKEYPNHSITEEVNPENSVHRNFWKCYQDIVSKKIQDDGKSPAAIELRSYCALPVIKRNDDPFDWWQKNSQRFPKMAAIAKIYLCCPASTVYSERLFSEAGNVYETKRNRLLPDRAEHLTFLHHNLPLLNREEIIKLSEGAYEIDNIASYIKTRLQKTSSRPIVFINANTNILKTEIKSTYSVFFNREILIGELLGFSKRELKPNTNIDSNLPVHINKVNSIRVECNIVTGSYMNNTPVHTVHEFALDVLPESCNPSDTILICVQNQDLILLPSESILYVEGTLSDKDGQGQDTIRLNNNCVAFMSDEIRYELNGIEIDHSRTLGITFLKNYISLNSNESATLLDSGWNLKDTRNMKMLLGFAEDYKKIIPNAKHELVLTRERSNDDSVYTTVANHAFRIQKISWKVLHISLNDVERLKLYQII
ncbi:hypothetical protein NQ317_007932 [Molorchus minor]|uniref:HAT C-terminal dimerisation domain-containing protein n=1 Tax=Molorchus minor TaxID=1323400 RepID=A0ABQ9JT13_9CUCU|nr:hypothetical protein NQ317_007932 [Molorchus minor]